MGSFHKAFNVKSRVREVLIGTQLLLLLAVIANYYSNHNLIITLCLSLAFFFNITPLMALYRERIELASGLYLLNLCSCLTIMIWLNSGLHDSALFAYPGLIIYAAILGTPRQFLLVTIFLCGSTFMLGYVHLTGIHVFKPAVIEWADPIDMTLLLIIISFALRSIFNDLKKVTAQLSDQVEEVETSRREIQHLAHHDALTGLPNRILAEDRFNRVLAHVKRKESSICLLFLDLDRFKTVNDNLGHDIGDLLLCQIARRLEGILREDDSICRFGGDEFMIILEAPTEELHLTAIAEKILASLGEPYDIESHRIKISGSVGITSAPHDGMDFNVLAKKAEMALQRAKGLGRNSIVFFDKMLNQQAEKKIALTKLISQGIQNHQFEVHFQPKINLHTNQLVAAEALARWPQEDGSWIAPEVFIPIAEESSLIVELGQLIIDQACQACVRWHQLGHEQLDIAINLSIVQFRDNNLLKVIRSALENSGLPPHHLEVEITESMLMDSSFNVSNQLHHIREMGVKISIDDFGTGYSNLAYINKQNLDVLKIDESIITEITRSSSRQTMVTAIVQLANGLGLQTVAEGVEDQQTMQYLNSIGCDFAQGFYWSEALNSDDFSAYLSNYQAQQSSLNNS